MNSPQTASSRAGTLICGMGRAPVSKQQVEKWCERSTPVQQTATSVRKAA